MVWNVRDTEGLPVPPGQYQARLTVGSESQTQRFNVLIDPRIEAGGVTVADLRELYEHNTKMNAMVTASRFTTHPVSAFIFVTSSAIVSVSADANVRVESLPAVRDNSRVASNT